MYYLLMQKLPQCQKGEEEKEIFHVCMFHIFNSTLLINVRQSEYATLKLKPQIPPTNKNKKSKKSITFKLQVFCDVIQEQVCICTCLNTKVRCKTTAATTPANCCCTAINNNKKI